MSTRPIINKLGILLIVIALSGCEDDYLDRALKIRRTIDDIEYSKDGANLKANGMAAYTYIREFTSLSSSAMLAAACDEADFAIKAATVQRFNTGGWNQFSNPDEVMSWYYRGIRQTFEFLKNSEDFERLLVVDTITPASKTNYLRDCDEVFKLRAENRFLRAWFYFEMVKRYGGVAIIREPLNINSIVPPRSTAEECFEYIIEELEIAYPDMVDYWVNYNIPNGALSTIGSGKGDGGGTDVTRLGRAEQVAVKAFKLRVLLYAASPLFNPTNDVTKWEAAAAAGHDFLNDSKLSWWRYLWTSYESLFNKSDQALLTSRKGKNSGIIFTTAFSAAYNNSTFESWNYPIGIPKGGTRITAPSQNLVDAYEVKVNATTAVPFDWNNPNHVANPYNPTGTLGRDPRLKFTIGVNGDIYGKTLSGANRPIESYVGGADAIGVKVGATTTGYYLKKMARTDFNLSSAPSAVKSINLLRYAEVLLNYAEAMNEAYSPDAKPSINGSPAVYSALEALNLVRTRNGVAMPPLPSGMSKEDFRDKLRNERRIELAFEEHRFFDVRRWKIAETTENANLMGIKVIPNDIVAPLDTFLYERFVAEPRIFDASKMYLYPIPESQVIINGWSQNPGW